LFDTLLFVVITLAIHYLFRLWANQYEYRIFGVKILTPSFMGGMTDIVYSHTKIVVDLILENSTFEKTFTFLNRCSVTIVSSCNGVKQILQFALLILVYPGPWKHKAWFIPMGIVIIHFTNVFRLAFLCGVMANWPQHWFFAHDYPARIIFYVVIFFLWVWWNDRFHHRKSKAKP